MSAAKVDVLTWAIVDKYCLRSACGCYTVARYSTLKCIVYCAIRLGPGRAPSVHLLVVRDVPFGDKVAAKTAENECKAACEQHAAQEQPT